MLSPHISVIYICEHRLFMFTVTVGNLKITVCHDYLDLASTHLTFL